MLGVGATSHHRTTPSGIRPRVWVTSGFFRLRMSPRSEKKNEEGGRFGGFRLETYDCPSLGILNTKYIGFF